MKTKSPSKLQNKKSMQNWLDENIQWQWVGRGGPQDCNITWPPRSPNQSPMDYFLWGYVKSKVYAKNYENSSDVEAAIISAFREVSECKIFQEKYVSVEEDFACLLMKSRSNLKWTCKNIFKIFAWVSLMKIRSLSYRSSYATHHIGHFNIRSLSVRLL